MLNGKLSIKLDEFVYRSSDIFFHSSILYNLTIDAEFSLLSLLMEYWHKRRRREKGTTDKMSTLFIYWNKI